MCSLYGTLIVVWNISTDLMFNPHTLDLWSLKWCWTWNAPFYCNTSRFWFQWITQKATEHYAKCPPVEMVSSPVCALRAPRAEARGTALALAWGRRTGALKQSSASGGCRPKRWEQIQHRPLLASRASRTSTHGPDRAMAAEPCSQIEAGGHHSGVLSASLSLERL